MLPVADMVQREVDPPHNRWCACGHVASETFRRDGADLPTRFFWITGHNINGIYCEPCLVIANWVSEQQKKIK